MLANIGLPGLVLLLGFPMPGAILGGAALTAANLPVLPLLLAGIGQP